MRYKKLLPTRKADMMLTDTNAVTDQTGMTVDNPNQSSALAHWLKWIA